MTNAIHAGLFGDPATEAAFSARAEVDAMIRVEVALAQVQAGLGVIPADAAAAIAATAPDVDPAGLAQATARNGVPVPALIAAMRAQMGDAGHHLHWGATSQDIVDTALALRLGPVLDLWDARLRAILARLAGLAGDHADLGMAARTYGQVATPTSFGAVAAGWGWPLLDLSARMGAVRGDALRVSLSGASGTLSAMGAQGAQVRAGLARALDLADPGRGWHSDRSGPGHLADWIAGLAATLGKLAEDLLLMTQSGLTVVRIDGAGGSSTMPQKQNPVGPSAMAALARQVLGLVAVFRAAGLHRQQRDGAAWFTEWLTLPQICVSTGAMLRLCGDVLDRLTPDAPAMARDLATGHGTIHAEALTFALTRHAGLDRGQAAARVGQLCRAALDTRTDLLDLAGAAWPGPDWPALVARQGMGDAPAMARAFHDRIAVPPRP